MVNLEKEFKKKYSDPENANLVKYNININNLWLWIIENFDPKVSRVDAEVKPDFCGWEWDIKRQLHKIGCGGYIGQGVDMLFEKVKYCPYCGKRLNKTVKTKKDL